MAFILFFTLGYVFHSILLWSKSAKHPPVLGMTDLNDLLDNKIVPCCTVCFAYE